MVDTMDQEQHDTPHTGGRQEPARRPYFGRRLRELRETYSQRAFQGGADAPILRATPSSLEVVQCMDRTSGYKISVPTYNEIENGLNVPREAARFLDAVSACLRLTPEERQDLADRMAYDILWAKLRERTESVFPHKSHWPAPEA